MPQIEGVFPDNARVVVKLAIGGKTVDISQYIVKLVGRKEYDRYSKDLSKWIVSATDLWKVYGYVMFCHKSEHIYVISLFSRINYWHLTQNGG